MHKSVALAAVTGLVVALAANVSVAAASVPPDHGPKRADPPSASASGTPDRRCTLSPSLNHSGGESASCIAVGANISAVPALNHTATLQITVKAARAEARTVVTVDLPSTFAFTDATATTAVPTGSGTVSRAAIATLDLAAGQTTTITRTVKAVRSGFGAIVVAARNRLTSARTDGGTDSVFATVGATAATSFAGGGDAATAAASHLTTRSARAVMAPRSLSGHAPRTAPASVAGGTRPADVHPDTAGTSCATGTWHYVDQNNVTRPAANTLVEVFNSSNTMLSYAVSAGDGSYTICWSTGGGSTSAYVKFVESNNIWRLTDNSNNVFSFSTGIVAVPDGTTHNYGSLQPGSANANPGLHAFAIANDEWQWVHQYYGGQCWSPFETACHQLTIHWQADSTTGTFWNSSGVYLLAGSPNTVDEVAHEVGHNLMYELYGLNYPATTNCSPHYLFTISSTTCAWTEGWADWVATSVYNNPVWTFNGGSTTDFDVTWNEGLGYDTGDQVEGRITQAMRSLTDGTKVPWDNDAGEGAGIRDNRNWFAVLNTYRPNTFAGAWSDRAALGQDVSQTALSALYQGTIDYGFRNPLATLVGKHFPQANPPHNYSFPATAGYWSVIAAKPDSGTDVDLSVYSDQGQSAFLDSSSYGGTSTDFVAINSNSGHRALQTYFPRVTQFAGTGGYTVEADQGISTLTAGTASVTLAATDLTHIWDSYQTVGTPVYYRAVPAAGQDVQLLATSAASNVVHRSAATSGADPGSAGTPATLVVTPTAAGYGGLILLNNSLTAGTVTIYADSSAPNGSVSIDGGAAGTPHQSVSLALSASDTQTGVDAMQISNDGTFDTEPVVAYATSAGAQLSSGFGVKTIYVRYRNNAGMWSAPVTDTISYQPVPSVTSTAPKAGRLSGGQTVTITGAGLGGASAVKFGTTAAAGFTVVNASKITAVTPAHAAGAVHVAVTTPSGTSAATAGNVFTFEAAPSVSKVAPVSGLPAGGHYITITGHNFTGATVVRFGSTATTHFSVSSPTRIVVLAPAHAAGAVHVRVSTPSGTSPTSSHDVFVYQAAPRITALSRSSGPHAGGTTVTITGVRFTGASTVRFGSVTAHSITVLGSTRIRVVSPAHAVGTVVVRVYTPSGNSGSPSVARYAFT